MPWSSGKGQLRTLLPKLFGVLVAGCACWGQSQTPAVSTPVVTSAPRAATVLVDAAHGGADPGALLTPTLAEKDVTLAVARRLCGELAKRNIGCQLLRDADATLSTDQRAGTANGAKAALYIAIHASSMGKGLRIFSSMLLVAKESTGPFTDWDTAQQVALERSRSLQQQLVSSIQNMGFPVRSLTAPLRPLNNVSCPALAVEVAPTTRDVSQLGSENYQDMVSAALANAISSIAQSLQKAGLP